MRAVILFFFGVECTDTKITLSEHGWKEGHGNNRLVCSLSLHHLLTPSLTLSLPLTDGSDLGHGGMEGERGRGMEGERGRGRGEGGVREEGRERR